MKRMQSAACLSHVTLDENKVTPDVSLTRKGEGSPITA